MTSRLNSFVGRCPTTARGVRRKHWAGKVKNSCRTAKQSLGWGDYQVRDVFAIERHIQLMMVAHAYPELRRQICLANVEPGKHITLGDIQREHQALSQRAEIALVFVVSLSIPSFNSWRLKSA